MAKVQQEGAEKCTLRVLEEWQVSQQRMMRNSKGSEYEKMEWSTSHWAAMFSCVVIQSRFQATVI